MKEIVNNFAVSEMNAMKLFYKDENVNEYCTVKFTIRERSSFMRVMLSATNLQIV